MTSTNRIAQLVEQLNEHNYRYAVLNDPVISDREYDALMRRTERPGSASIPI